MGCLTVHLNKTNIETCSVKFFSLSFVMKTRVQRQLRGFIMKSLNKTITERTDIMFIKDLLNRYKATKLIIQELANADQTDSFDYTNAVKTMNALKELKDFIINGNWTRDESRKKFVAWIKSHFDYKLTAERFDTSRESLDVFISRQDKRLSKLMGEALALISQGRVDEGLCSFYAKSGIISAHEYQYRITDLLPQPEKNSDVDLCDCSQEIYLLQMLMRKEMQDRLSDADTDCMAHLLFLLGSSDPTYAKQKKELIQLLLKKDSSEENG